MEPPPPKLVPRAADPAFASVARPDDAPDFLRCLSPDLPEPIREVGVRVSEEARRYMDGLLDRSGGRSFAGDAYAASVALLNPFEGPLDTVGLVEMKRFIGQIQDRAKEAKWNPPELARQILWFVQREIAYAPDEATTGHEEYGRFPLQTLRDGHGDCDCKALLCCALLSYCGRSSVLLVTGDHALCGLLPPGKGAPWLSRWLPRRLAARCRWGEATRDDGGRWKAPEASEVAAIQAAILIPPLDLNAEE